MLATRFDRVAWGATGLLGIALAGLLGLRGFVGVRLSGTIPLDGGEVGSLEPIGIEFGEEMRIDEVETRFQVEPAVSGRITWEGNRMWFTPDQPWQAGQTYTARLGAGAPAVSGRSLRQEVVWEYRTRLPRVLYLSSTNGPREVWRWSETAGGGRTEQLTETGGKVFDYAGSRDGTQLAYSVLNEHNGSDLWLRSEASGQDRLLLACGSDQCNQPSWSPDGRRLAFSRAVVDPLTARPGAPRVWTISAESGEAAALYEDSQILGFGPVWSPRGDRLAFFDGNAGGIRVVTLATGQNELLASELGLVGAWSPDGGSMLFNVLRFVGPQPSVEIQLADFATQQVRPILGQGMGWTEAGVPEWSADGAWILIGIKARADVPGRQLWLARSDGSEARSLLDDPDYTFGGYHWDPTGERVLLQRFQLRQVEAVPEVVLFSPASGELQVIARDAWWATWAP